MLFTLCLHAVLHVDNGLRAACCRSRHLMLDLAQLLPHCKRDSKLDTKTDRGVINEVADMKVGHGAGPVCSTSDQSLS